MCCQSFSITLKAAQFFVKIWVFEHLKLISSCEQREMLPDFCVWYFQLLIYLFCNGKAKYQAIISCPAVGYLKTDGNISLTNNSVEQMKFVLTNKRGGKVLLWLECTQRNAIDGHSRVNTAHFILGEEISSRSINCSVIGKVVELLPHTRTM